MITKAMKALGFTLGLSLGFVGVSGLPALGEKAILKTVSTRVVRPINVDKNANIKLSEPAFELRVIGRGQSRVVRPDHSQSFQRRTSRPIPVIENPEPVLGRFVNVPFVDARDRFDRDSLPFLRLLDGMGRPINFNSMKDWREVSINNSGSVFYLNGNLVGDRVNDFIAIATTFGFGLGRGLRIKKLERDVSNPQNFILYYNIVEVNCPHPHLPVFIPTADIIAIQRPNGLIGSPIIEPRFLGNISEPCNLPTSINVPFVNVQDRFDRNSLPFVNDMGRPINSTKNWKEVSRNSSGSLFWKGNGSNSVGSVFHLDGNSVGDRVNDFIALSMVFPTGGYGLQIKKVERDLLNLQNFILYYSVSTPGSDCMVTMAFQNFTNVIVIQRPTGLIGSPSIEPRLVETSTKSCTN